MNFRTLLRALKKTVLVHILRWKMCRAQPLNVILGAGPSIYQGCFSINLKVLLGTASSVYYGWFSTEMSLLNITSPSDWQKLFRPASIDRLLAEHVLEHLSESENRIALQQSYCYLKKGGTLRIAVPDGYRRDENYIKKIHPPQDGHKTLFTVDTIVPLLEEIGFHVTPLEFFDVQEQFHHCLWDQDDGYIERTFHVDTRENFRREHMFYTSLIVDAEKPN